MDQIFTLLCNLGVIPKELCGIPGIPHYGPFMVFLISFLSFLNVLVKVIIALALVFFLWGMALFILNSGNEDKRSEGKQKMFWGIIALAVMIAIWGIVRLLASVFLPFGGAPLPPIFLPDVLPR